MTESLYADTEAPIALLSAKHHFDQLPTTDAKLYAHYFSKALHWGSRAVLRSVSPESEGIYDWILAIHSALGAPSDVDAYHAALEGLPATVIKGYLEYASQFLANLGNFKSFGDQKFIPRISVEELDALVKKIDNKDVTSLYEKIRTPLFSTDHTLLGWPDKAQVSAYYPQSPQITREEIEAVNAVLAKNGIMPENTRVQKTDSGLVVHVASAETANKTDIKDTLTDNGVTVRVQFGDHAHEFAKIVENLRKAQEHAANDTQRRMLDAYIEAFATGSMQAHKESQKLWVKDLQPSVETNIGFIETYRDPSGVRGEWEGLVAMVNQERTAKFGTLVNEAARFIAELPWDRVYEKDTFSAPDFTSLEVLTFAGSGVPAGINIPNYDDVRLNVGFKNVSLGNVLSANPKKPRKKEEITFLNEAVGEKFRKWREDAFEVQVGLHELLGHGTGKLLQRVGEGYNFDRDAHPEVTSWYGPHDTWGSSFGSIAGSFEECRAELVALYLILKKPLEVLPIFGITDSGDQADVREIATLLMVRAGLLGLEFWDPASAKWGQAHMQARFAIAKVLHGAGVFSFKHGADLSDLEIVLDVATLDNGVAERALGDFLNKLHVFKCSGNVKDGVAFYNEATTVSPEYAQYRDTVLAKKLPRKHLIQCNTVAKDGSVDVLEYEESEVGMIQSFYEREI